MAFRLSPPTVVVTGAPYAPRWLIDNEVGVHRIEHPRNEPLDVAWIFRPFQSNNTQDEVALRRGTGTVDDPFFYWNGNNFVSSAVSVPTTVNSLRLTGWLWGGETRAVFQVATKAHQSSQLSPFSAALEVIDGVGGSRPLFVGDDGLLLEHGTQIGQMPVVHWRVPRQFSYRITSGDYDSGEIRSENRYHTLMLEPGNFSSGYDATIVLNVKRDDGLGFNESQIYRAAYRSVVKPQPTVTSVGNTVELTNIGLSSGNTGQPVGDYDYIDIYRRFRSVHSDAGSEPASLHGFPYPDEQLIAERYSRAQFGLNFGAIKYVDASVRNEFEYEYKVVGYAVDRDRHPQAMWETFNESDWVG